MYVEHALKKLCCRDLFSKYHSHTHRERKKLLKLELHIRNTLARLSALIVAMDDELSLMPKPMSKYRKTVEMLQDILDIMTGIRKIRENIPTETVSSVLNERREFVSTVCLTLYATEHAFRARQPLPQFLPSGRTALTKLVSHIDASLRAAPCHASGLSVVYAIAEREVLHDLVDALDRLLGTCRVLFGTATWLQAGPYWKMSLGDDDDESPAVSRDGWHSS